MRIPGIYVAVQGDLSQLEVDLNRARGMVRASAESISNDMGNALSGKQITSGISSLITRLSELDRASKVSGVSLKGLGVDLKDLQRLTGQTKESFDAMQARFLENRAAKAAEQSLRALSSALGLSKNEVKAWGEQYKMSVESVESVLKSLGMVSGTPGKGLGDILKNTFLYGGAYQILGNLQQMGREFVAIQGKLDGLRRSFDGIYGANGAAQFQYVIDTANRYGKSLDSVADSYRKFSAAAEYVGMTTAQSRAVFESVTQAITKVGGSSEDVQGTLLALQQMISKGTVSSEEFRLQFAERVPGAMKMGADALGVTTSEFKRMLEQGQIVAKDFIPKLTTQLDVFSKGWEKAADSIDANAQRALNSFKLLAENRYVKDILNSVLQFGASLADSLNKGAQAWGDFFAVRAALNKGLLDKGGTFNDAREFVKNYQGMGDEVKLGLYQRRIAELNAKLQQQFPGKSITEGSFAARSETYVQKSQLESDARWLQAQVEVRKELDQLAKSMHVAAISGTGDLGAIIDRTLELKKYLEGLTGQPYKINFVKDETLADIDAILSRVDSVWQKTAGYAYSAAEKNQTQAKQDITELEKQIQVRKEQLQYAPGEQLHKQILDDIDTYTKALEKATASEIDAAKKQEEAAKTLQRETLERTNPFTGTSPSDFLDPRMKEQSRMAGYYDELIKNGYWERINSLDPNIRKVAAANQQGSWQKYLDGVKSDQMEVLRRQQQGQAFVENTDSSMRTLYDSLTGNSEKDTEKTARWFTKAINDAKIAMADAKGDLTPYRQELEKLYSVYDQFMRAAQIKDFAANLQKQASVLRDLATSLYSPQMERQSSWLQNYAQYITELNSGDATIRSMAQPKWDAYQKFSNQEYARKLGEGGKLSGDYWSGETDKLKQHLEAVRQETSDEVAYRIYAAQKIEELEKQKLEAGVSYSTSFTDFLRGQASLEYGLYQGAHSRQLEEWKAYYEDIKGVATGFYDTLKSGVADSLDGLFTGKAEEAWKNMLASMRRQFLQFLVDIAFDFMKHNFVKPALEQMLGGGSAASITQIGRGYTVAGGGNGIVLPNVVEQLREYNLPDATPSSETSGTQKMVEKATKGGPIWLTHNNPGNIRSVKGGFLSYASMEDGARGISDWLERNGKRGYDTIEKIGNRYAPPSENNTSAWVSTVENVSGYNKGQKLDLSDPEVRQNLARGIIRIETGRKSAVSDDTLYRATHLTGPADSGIVKAAESLQNVASGAATYGTVGAFWGPQGAQTILSRISANNGILGALTGDMGASAFVSQIKAATPTAGGAAGATMAFIGGGAAVSGSSTTLNLATGFTPTDLYNSLVADGASATEASAVANQYAQAQALNASSSSTAQQAQQKSGSNGSMSDLMKGGDWSGKIDRWGYDNLGIGSEVPTSWSLNADQAAAYEGWVQQGADPAAAWEAAAKQGGTSITNGLGSMAGGALTGAATGMSISSLIYPNGTGTVGGTIGGAVGGAAGSALLGSIGGPIGGLVGGIIGSLVTGGETKKTEKTGSGVTVDMTQPGQINQSGYSTYRTTTSGMFGSSSTSHSKSYDTVGDPELEAQFRSTLENYVSQTFRSAISMNLSAAGMKDLSFPFKFDIDSSNSSFAAKAVANYQALEVIKANGLQEDFDATAKSGEVYVDQIARISKAYASGSINALAASTSLEKLSGSMSVVFQGDWFSKLSDLLGGTDQATAAFTTYTKYGMSQKDAVNAQLNATGITAGKALAQIGDPTVSLDNFWQKYGQAMQGEISPEQMSYWANAATAVSQFDDSQRSSLSLMQNINTYRIAQLKAEMDAVQEVKVVVDGVRVSVSSAYSTYKSLNDTLISSLQGIKWNSSLSPNTSTQTFQQQQAYYNQLKAKVMGESPDSLTYTGDVQKLSSFSQTYLTTARSYYGASSQYWDIYKSVTGTLDDLQQYTQSEVDVLLQQLKVQNEAIQKAQQQIDQLTLVNENLALLGSGLDGLGVSIQAGLETLGAQMSWTPSIADAISSANDAYTTAANSIASADYSQFTTTGTSAATTSTGDLLYDGSGDYAGFLGGFASGGTVDGPGWFMAGENGPEPVFMGGGGSARVTNNSDFTGSMDRTAKVSAAGFSALLAEMRGLRQEMATIRSETQRSNAAPARQ